MHVAICKDDVADRKQLERLMGRESLRRTEEKGALYVDSFGNVDRLLSNPLVYDVFFIDICHTTGVSSLEVVHSLIKKGVTATFVLICSNIDYRKQDFPEKVIFMNYPVKPEELMAALDEAQERLKDVIPPIELREDCADISYVDEDEIIYAREKMDFTYVTLTRNREMRLRLSATTLFAEIEKRHPCFILPNRKYILNCHHIQSFGLFGKAVMVDGAHFHIPKRIIDYAKNMQENTQETD